MPLPFLGCFTATLADGVERPLRALPVADHSLTIDLTAGMVATVRVEDCGSS